MSKGKYSPTVWTCEYNRHDREFNCNAKGVLPVAWTKGIADSGVKYDQETMFGNYDSEGFDSYGYSAYLKDGTFVGIGQGVDRNGLTEDDYLGMSDEEFENL